MLMIQEVPSGERGVLQYLRWSEELTLESMDTGDDLREHKNTALFPSKMAIHQRIKEMRFLEVKQRLNM